MFIALSRLSGDGRCQPHLPLRRPRRLHRLHRRGGRRPCGGHGARVPRAGARPPGRAPRHLTLAHGRGRGAESLGGPPRSLVSVAASRSQPRGRPGGSALHLASTAEQLAECPPTARACRHAKSARSPSAADTCIPPQRPPGIWVMPPMSRKRLGKRVPPTPQPGGPKMFAANAYVIRPATEIEE